MQDNKPVLCRAGLHIPTQPMKDRRVGSSRDMTICSRCKATKTMLSGWHRYGDEEKYFDESFLRDLEKSCAFASLGYSLPWEMQLKIVGNMGHDVSKELAQLEEMDRRIKEAEEEELAKLDDGQAEKVRNLQRTGLTFSQALIIVK